MGTIYFRRDSKKWRVQFKDELIGNVSYNFSTFNEAQEFHNKAKKVLLQIKELKKDHLNFDAKAGWKKLIEAQEEANKVTWESSPTGSFILERTGFFISYQPFNIPTWRFNSINHMREETAICVEEKKDQYRYYILYGDWRKQYEECGDCLGECLKFYDRMKKDFKSFFSTE
jgi:hypothetical protein